MNILKTLIHKYKERRRIKNLINICNFKTYLSEWETNFVKDISKLWKLTVKQKEKLTEISEKKRPVYKRDWNKTPMYEYDESIGDYAYIHDFDK